MNSKSWVVIPGGKVLGGRGGGKGGGGKKPPRRHWLAGGGGRRDLLFEAISRIHYDERATGQRQIAARMTLLSVAVLGLYTIVDEQMVTRVLNVVRDNPLLYGYDVNHVQKGAIGEDRGFFPILVDQDDEAAYFHYPDEDDIDYQKYGAVSSTRSMMSMMRHLLEQLRRMSAVDPDFVQVADACGIALQQVMEAVARAEAII